MVNLEISIDVAGQHKSKTLESDKTPTDISRVLKLMFIKHSYADGVLTIRKTVTRDSLVKALNMAKLKALEPEVPSWSGSADATVSIRQI